MQEYKNQQNNQNVKDDDQDKTRRPLIRYYVVDGIVYTSSAAAREARNNR